LNKRKKSGRLTPPVFAKRLLFAIKYDTIVWDLKKEVHVMARTANIYTRVDPIVKEQAEEILEELGIPMSNAIGMFLRQIVIHNGIPFDMKLPPRRPLAHGEHTKEQLDAEIQKGFDDVESGRVYSSAEVESHMKSRFNL